MEKALADLVRQKVGVHGAGCTDAGVHSRGQIIHFDFPFEIDPVGLMIGMNAKTTTEITISNLIRVDYSFHARHMAKGKRYSYRVYNSRFKDPSLQHYSYHHRYPNEKR